MVLGSCRIIGSFLAGLIVSVGPMAYAQATGAACDVFRDLPLVEHDRAWQVRTSEDWEKSSFCSRGSAAYQSAQSLSSSISVPIEGAFGVFGVKMTESSRKNMLRYYCRNTEAWEYSTDYRAIHRTKISDRLADALSECLAQSFRQKARILIGLEIRNDLEFAINIQAIPQAFEEVPPAISGVVSPGASADDANALTTSGSSAAVNCIPRGTDRKKLEDDVTSAVYTQSLWDALVGQKLNVNVFRVECRRKDVDQIVDIKIDFKGGDGKPIDDRDVHHISPMKIHAYPDALKDDGCIDPETGKISRKTRKTSALLVKQTPTNSTWQSNTVCNDLSIQVVAGDRTSIGHVTIHRQTTSGPRIRVFDGNLKGVSAKLDFPYLGQIVEISVNHEADAPDGRLLAIDW